MRRQRGYRSAYVEDRRGAAASRGGGGGALVLAAMLASRGGKWGLLAALVIVALSVVGGGLGTGLFDAPAPSPQARQGVAAEDPERDLVSFVLDDVQGVWREKLGAIGVAYEPARLVLFTGATRSGCGAGLAEVGPFYCPRDQRVYLDLSFFDELSRRFGAPGDFAQAYVIAHEIGHHVQHQLGITSEVGRLKRRDPTNASRWSVALELQADCYAGVWAHDGERRALLERGDLDEALAAAAAVGDDVLQRRAQGTVSPETFTHGTARERAAWFRRGYESGDPAACDTFADLRG